MATEPVVNPTPNLGRPMAEIRTEPLLYHEPAASEAFSTSFFDWRGVLAGTAVALLVHAILIAAGFAFGAINLRVTFDGFENGWAFGAGPVVWAAFSMIVSTFVGGYVTGRLSVRKFVEAKLGWIHGAVVAALFFGIAFFRIGSFAGSLLRATDAAAISWIVFGALLVGTVLSMFGGVVGARVQIRAIERAEDAL